MSMGLPCKGSGAWASRTGTGALAVRMHEHLAWGDWCMGFLHGYDAFAPYMGTDAWASCMARVRLVQDDRSGD